MVQQAAQLEGQVVLEVEPLRIRLLPLSQKTQCNILPPEVPEDDDSTFIHCKFCFEIGVIEKDFFVWVEIEICFHTEIYIFLF